MIVEAYVIGSIVGAIGKRKRRSTKHKSHPRPVNATPRSPPNPHDINQFRAQLAQRTNRMVGWSYQPRDTVPRQLGTRT